MSKNVIAGIVALVIVLVGAGAYVASINDADDKTETVMQSTTPTTTDTAPTTTPSVTPSVTATPTATTTPVGTATPTPTPTPTAKTSYTMAEVATHNSRSSCWTAVNSGVYDLTAWIAKHPGGPAAITKICGVDGSKQFNEQHGGQAQAEAALAGFKIGSFVK